MLHSSTSRLKSPYLESNTEKGLLSNLSDEEIRLMANRNSVKFMGQDN